MNVIVYNRMEKLEVLKMNRLQTYYEQLQLPLKSLFLGCFLITIGSIIANPYIVMIFKFNSPLFVTASKLLLYAGGIILSYFPLYVFIKLLTHRNDETNVVVTGFISYLVFLVVMTLLSPTTSPKAAYSDILNITIGNESYGLFKTGIFGFLAVLLVVRYCYRSHKETTGFSQVSYLDRDTIKLVNSIIGSAIVGAIFAYGWPMFVDGIYNALKFISSDSHNPMSLFAYGGLERLLTLGNIQTMMHQEIWLGSLGGSWMNIGGETFVGDANIWTAQLKEGLNMISGAGRYTSAYYVLNLFAIPGYLLAVISTVSNKKVLKKNISLFIIVILTSMLGGIIFPVELLMLLTSPILYFFHLFMTAFIYAILVGFGATVGFSYLGTLTSATPGNLIDFIGLMRNTVMFNKIMIILLVGIITFIIYFAMTRFYYSRMAIDVLNIGSKKERVNDFIERLGGLENIEAISSTPTHIHVALRDRDELNVSGLHRQGVTRIVETRQGFTLSVGSSAYMLQRAVNRHLDALPKEETEE